MIPPLQTGILALGILLQINVYLANHVGLLDSDDIVAHFVKEREDPNE